MDYVEIRIVGISDPTHPTEVGSIKTANYVWDVGVMGNYAYLVETKGLHIMDISNPATPVEVGLYPIPGEARRVEVATRLSSTNSSQPYLYLITKFRDLRIFDLSEPMTPTEIAAYDTPSFVQDVAMADQYAYVADGYEGLYVVDISNPAQPIKVGLYNQHGGACNVETADHYVYVTFGDCISEYHDRHYGDFKSDLYVLDIANPTTPAEVAFYDLPEGESGGRWAKLQIQGDYAYIIDGTSLLHVLDISKPTAPKKIKALDGFQGGAPVGLPNPTVLALDLAIQGEQI